MTVVCAVILDEVCGCGADSFNERRELFGVEAVDPGSVAAQHGANVGLRNSTKRIAHLVASMRPSSFGMGELNFADMVSAGNSYLWQVNKKSYSYGVLFVMMKNISRIKNPIDDLREILLKKMRRSAVKRVVLFGSVAKKQEQHDSDIDIFILLRNKQSRKKIELVLEELSKVCLEKYGNRLSPYILTEREMSGKKNLKIIENINKGIQIIPEKKI